MYTSGTIEMNSSGPWKTKAPTNPPSEIVSAVHNYYKEASVHNGDCDGVVILFVQLPRV